MSVPAFLHPFARPAAADFTSIVGGEGAIVWDADGRRYVDALASLWYCNVGHGRSELVEAITAQLGQLACFHTFDRFTNPPADALADTLVGLAPFPDARVFFTSSGSEAVDSALKLARLAHAVAGQPERRLIVSRAPSYHGVTYGGMAATGLPENQTGFGAMVPDVIQVPYDDVAALRRVFDEHGPRIAAVIAEPVVGGGGVWTPPAGYFATLRELCDAHGAFFISDEVICGFGRLGEWWGAQHFGVQPDLVTFAKGVTSGYVPLGGVLLSQRVHEPLAGDPAFVLRHGHTYSGHPTACAAALANIEVIRETKLLDAANRIGGRLDEGLRELVTEGLVDHVRGDGAIWAAAFADDATALAVRDEMLERGVIARPIGSAVAMCPPLVIDDADVDRILGTLADAARTVQA